MKITVTGAAGLLGTTLCHSWRDVHTITASTRHNAFHMPGITVDVDDVSNETRTVSILERTRPDVIVHCSAMTDVDACERDAQSAYHVNTDIPRRIASWCAQQDVYLVYISTDAVFDGDTGSFTERDPPNPVNSYARSKLAGEEAILQEAPTALIARTNHYGWSNQRRTTLAEFFIERLERGEAAPGFTDVTFTPLLTQQLAQLLLHAIEARLEGTFHFASREAVTKYQLGQTIATTFGQSIDLITPALSSSIAFDAPRTRTTSLDATRIARRLDVDLPTVADGIRWMRTLRDDGIVDEIRSTLSRKDPLP